MLLQSTQMVPTVGNKGAGANSTEHMCLCVHILCVVAAIDPTGANRGYQIGAGANSTELMLLQSTQLVPTVGNKGAGANSTEHMCLCVHILCVVAAIDPTGANSG